MSLEQLGQTEEHAIARIFDTELNRTSAICQRLIWRRELVSVIFC